jgi:aryl carrier-like protein
MENEGKGIDPEEIRVIGGEYGYEVRVSWPSTGRTGSYEVLLRKATQQPAAELPMEGKVEEGMRLSEQGRGWSRYANRPLADWGEGGSAVELLEYLQERLPGYMAPVAYVELEKLPLTPNGKVDRKALPAPEGGAYVRRGYEPPVGEIEAKLAQIWGDLLKVERVGRHDNFFELGGHSLMAVSLVERMRQVGLRTDVRTLFTTPILSQLAAAMEEMEIRL